MARIADGMRGTPNDWADMNVQRDSMAEHRRTLRKWAGLLGGGGPSCWRAQIAFGMLALEMS